MDKLKSIWIIMGHPLQLPLALAISTNLPSNITSNLVISKHKYWQNIDVQTIKKYFNNIIFFNHIDYAHSITGFMQILLQLLKTRKQIKKLPIKKEDVLVSLEAWNYVENLVTSAFSNNKQIFLCPEGIYPIVSQTPAQLQARNSYVTVSGYVHHYFVEPALRLKKKTYDYWDNSTKESHGLTYSDKVENYYDLVFILKSLFTKNLQPNEIYYPYPVLRNLSQPNSNKKKIVFFLSGFLNDSDYNNKINLILKNLKNLYQADYDLEIRFHPNQPESDKFVDCTSWKINREKLNAEQYLVKYANETAFVFSDKSTFQIFAMNLGIPSYSYHRVMGLDKKNVAWHDKTYAAAPQKFFMQSLKQNPQTYEPVANALQKAKGSLDKLFQEF